ncbi:hypothetical protein PHLCEN_2v3163 [Hermanssonia centrifuga]|uniref:Fungal-type protein kinase domain-containing protein n=1 Tax=Hermanssonia centrifuga TaxID=98765 RepID=A0A2R6R142_9APHY|nr:hypothetical protein PHLCEN_2v3163 [Hermanssonia centrifuga]
MFAEAHQLGWDPTMKSLADGRIEIAVQSGNDGEALYRTINLLSDIGSADLIGRGTRVWKAVKMVNGEEFGEPVALKDSWVDYSRKREGAIHERIRESILATAQAELFTRHFLTVECYGDVLVLDEQDRTRPPQDHSLSSSPELALTSIHTSEYHQVHHRIVFKEVGLPLSKVTSLLEVFNALGDVVDGLRCLHECGWVHRDISTGNVVIVDGIAKITDLEYATSDDETVKVGKTGTIFFRPVEVDGPSYMFLPPPKLPPPSRPIDRKARMARWAASYDDPSLPPPALRKRSPRQEEPKAPRISKYGNLVFRYNPLHDLESVWWMAVYFVFNREVDIDDDGVDTETRRMESQRQFARELFYQAIPRLRVMASEAFFGSHLDCLHPSIAPIGEILEDARIELVAGYRRAEEDIQTIGRHAANGLHAEFKQQFLIIANQLRMNDLPLRRFNERTCPRVIPAVDAVIEARDL